MEQTKEDKSLTLVKAIKRYLTLKLEYLQLSFAERVAILIGNMVFITFIAIFGLILFVLLLIMIDKLLMMWIGIAWLVVLIEITFTALVITFFWIFRNKLIITPVSNMIIRTLLDASGKIKTNDEEDGNNKQN